MKKAAILLALTLIPVAGYAQQSKQELKDIKQAERAERKAEKAEQRRIRDSIYWAKDSIYWAEWEAAQQAQRAENGKKGCTALLIRTPFEEPKMVMDALVHRMIKDGNTPAYIDKEYYIIRSAPKQVFNATYETTYTIYLDKGKVCVRAGSVARGSFSVGVGMFRSNTDMVVPVEYGGVKDSLCDVAWREMESYLLEMKCDSIEYIKQ